MTISYNPPLTNEQYRTFRYDAISWMEEPNGVIHLAPYSDNPNGSGYATIGVGFKINSNVDEILKAFGFDTRTVASQAEKDYITRIRRRITQGGRRGTSIKL